jgi:tetratricopeptide (TPR) repeat protein
MYKIAILFLLVISIILSCDNEGNEQSKNLNSRESAANSVVKSDASSIEKLLIDDSLNIGLLLNLGSIYYSSGDIFKAEKTFLKVYSIQNNNMDALINLGNIYYDSGRNEDAINFYKKALEIDSKNTNVRCDMATCYGNLNNLNEAMKLLNENLLMDPNHAQSHHNLSIFLEKMGDKSGAAKEMELFNKLK